MKPIEEKTIVSSIIALIIVGCMFGIYQCKGLTMKKCESCELKTKRLVQIKNYTENMLQEYKEIMESDPGNIIAVTGKEIFEEMLSVVKGRHGRIKRNED